MCGRWSYFVYVGVHPLLENALNGQLATSPLNLRDMMYICTVRPVVSGVHDKLSRRTTYYLLLI